MAQPNVLLAVCFVAFHKRKKWNEIASTSKLFFNSFSSRETAELPIEPVEPKIEIFVFINQNTYKRLFIIFFAVSRNLYHKI